MMMMMMMMTMNYATPHNASTRHVRPASRLDWLQRNSTDLLVLGEFLEDTGIPMRPFTLEFADPLL